MRPNHGQHTGIPREAQFYHQNLTWQVWELLWALIQIPETGVFSLLPRGFIRDKMSAMQRDTGGRFVMDYPDDFYLVYFER